MLERFRFWEDSLGATHALPLQRLEESLHETNWRFLTLLATSKGGPADKTGKVEFIAEYFSQDGQAHELHERSCFKRYQGVWKYLDASG
jgi:SEC-C motif-containing protein